MRELDDRIRSALAGLRQAPVPPVPRIVPAKPERRAFLDDFKDKEGYWTSVYHNASIIAYNTNLLKPADLPKSYDDLLDPKWKGKMLMDNRETEWYASMLQVLGREKGQ